MRRSHFTLTLPSSRDHYPHRIAVLGTQALAVHRVNDDRVVEHFFHGDRARMRRCIGAFEQHPFAARIDAASSSSVEAGTPVHSTPDRRPWVCCTVATRA